MITRMIDRFVAVLVQIIARGTVRAFDAWAIDHVRETESNREDIESLRDELSDVQRRIRRLEALGQLRARGIVPKEDENGPTAIRA